MKYKFCSILTNVTKYDDTFSTPSPGYVLLFYKIIMIILTNNLITIKLITNKYLLFINQIRCLRSRNNNLFDVPKTHLYSQFGDKRLSVMGSKLWNKLPAQIRGSESVSQFKSQLKTLLFKLAYDSPPKL